MNNKYYLLNPKKWQSLLTSLCLGCFLTILSVSQLSAQVFCDNCSGTNGPCAYPSIANNDDLDASCTGMKILFVIDESGSTDNFQTEIEEAVMTFLQSLQCVGVNMAVIEFNATARYVRPNYTLVDDAFIDGMQEYFDDDLSSSWTNQIFEPYDRDSDGDLESCTNSVPFCATNWQAALLAADQLSTPDLVLFFTDGVPTSYSTGSNPNFTNLSDVDICNNGANTQRPEIVNAMKLANKLKNEGAHFFALGIGAFTGANQIQLERISGSDGYDPNDANSNIRNSDFAADSFDQLAECLATFADDLCEFDSDVSASDGCPGDDDGELQIQVPANLLPVTYTYDGPGGNDGNGSSNTSPITISNLPAGDYEISVEISLGSNCTRTETFFETIGSQVCSGTPTIDCPDDVAYDCNPSLTNNIPDAIPDPAAEIAAGNVTGNNPNCDVIITHDGDSQVMQDANDDCLFYIIRTYRVDNKCGGGTNTCTQRFEWRISDLSLSTCPADVDLDGCTDQTTLDDAWNNWIAGLNGMSANNGCNAVLTFDPPIENLTKPTICSSIDYSQSVIVKAEDDCEEVVCTTSFALDAYPGGFTIGQGDGSMIVACIGDISVPTPPDVNDACGDPIIPSGPTITDDPATITCEGTRTYKWTYTDCEGTSKNWSFIYTIEYEEFQISVDDGAKTVTCLSEITEPDPPSVDDNCGNNLTPTGPEITDEPNPLDCVGTRTYTWTYKDCEGNEEEWKYVYTISIDASMAPDAGNDDGSTVECISEAIAPTPPEVDDACGNAITPTGPEMGGTYNGCEGTRTFTWTYMDCAGNMDKWTYTYLIDLTTGPNAGDDDGETVECIAEATAPTPPSIKDACSNTITPTGPEIGGTYDGCEGTRTYTWTYMDCAGNMDKWTYTYLINLTTGPNAGDDDGETVECISEATAPTPPSVKDACGNTITPTGPEIGGSYDGCEGTRTYTWTYMDCAGNMDKWIYTYLIDLTTGPNAGDDDSETVECIAEATAPTPPSVKDACGNTITPTGPEIGGTYDGCEGTRTYTWTYKDCAGNMDKWTYTYLIDLTTGPNAGDDDGETVECIAEATAPTPPSVKDACGNAITPTGPEVGGTYDGCEGTRTYTWTYMDCADNMDKWTYTYLIEYESFTIAAADGEQTVTCLSEIVEPVPPAVNDNCGNAITPSGPEITDEPNPLNCVGTRTYTWTYKDCEGNEDKWKYVYTLDIDASMGPDAGADDGETVECLAEATAPTPPSVKDACGNAITPTGPEMGGTYDGCEGTRTFTWTYMDCAGNMDKWTYTYLIDLTTGPNAGDDDGETVECIAEATAPTPPSINDACGNAITPTGPEIGGTYDGCEGTRTYTWTYMDCAGNMDKWTYTYLIDLTTGPNAGDDDGETVECIAEATAPTPPSVKDACGNTITPTGPEIGGTYNGCEGTRTYTWTYMDCAGNMDKWIYTYLIDLTTGPNAGDDDGETVECIAEATAPTPPSINDACGNAITPTGPEIGGTYDGCEGTRTYTWTYMDCAGNMDKWTYTYLIDLTTGPNAGADDGETVACIAEATAPTPPSIKDACGNVITPTGPEVGGTYDGCEGTRTYTWTYMDCAGNMDKWTYTYLIEYEGFTIAAADGEQTVTCLSEIVEPVPPAVNDNCGNAITPSGPEITDEPNPLNCVGTRTYTWTYKDCEGNEDKWKYVYTLDIDASMGPDAGADDGETVECIAEATAPTPPSIKDACGNAITPTGPEVGGTYDGCEGTRTYTWTYMDCAGNMDKWTYTYLIDLTTGPNAGADDGETVECIAEATAPTPPSIKDVCGNSITPTGPEVGGTYNGCEGTRTYTWTYMDCAGNMDKWTYTYLIDLTTGPNAGADDDETVECIAEATAPTPPSIKDACGNAITPTGPEVGGTYDGCEGTRTYTWTYMDCAGNMDKWTYTYLIGLTTGPNAGADDGETVACIAEATAPTPPSIKDACGNVITPTGPEIGGTYDGCEGTRTYTWTYMDCAGNMDKWTYTYLIEYEGFTIAAADGEQTVTCLSEIIEPVPPAVNDNCGNAITPSGPEITDEPNPLNCVGTRTYTWTYKDCEGNEDKWKYVYTLDIDASMGPDAGADDGETVECIAEATAPTPPSIKDACGNSITPTGPEVGGTYDGCEGTRTFTWMYMDCAGNMDKWTYTYLIDLTTGPNAGADDGETVECIAEAIAPTPPSIKDVCGNTITPTGPEVGGTYDGCEGTRSYTWTYMDCAGNMDKWTYTYLIDLTTGPNAGADDDETVECIAEATAPTPPSIKDACGNSITPTGPEVGGTYNSCEGTRTFTWTYMDCAGNMDKWTYTYLIDLTTGPNAGDDDGETVECIAEATAPTPPSIKDACGNVITPTGPEVGGTYDGCEGTRTYTWTYMDCAGNMDKWTYTYLIDLTTGPNAGADDGETVECIAEATAPTPPSVNDACGNAITPTGPEVGGTYDGCEGTRTYTWTYMDCAGNMDKWTYTYLIDLTTGPNAGADDGETVECIAEATAPTPPSVKDACGNSITPTGPELGGTYDGCEGTRTFTWTYMDCAGNMDKWTYTYLIDLTTGPNAGADDGETVECIAEAIAPTPPNIKDACGNSITPTGPEVGGTYDGCEGTRTYTWTYMDCAGNMDKWTYTYLIDLTTGPNAGADDGETVECIAEATAPTPPSIKDACSNVITPTGPEVGGTYDGCEGTRTFTWTYMDCAGNMDKWTYTYLIDLTTGPNAGADDGETVGCIAEATAPTPPNIKDACGNSITPTSPEVGGTYDGCEGTRTYTWTYMDCAGNMDKWTYTYLIDLTTGPNAGADDGETVECIAEATAPTPPSIKDACGNAVTPTGPEIGGTYDGCEGTRTYTWTYMDCAGNMDKWTYTYLIDLTTGPNAGDDDGETVECIAEATAPTPPSIKDACGNAVTPTGPEIGGTYDGCEGTRTYTWTYMDCAGNTDKWTYTYLIDLTTGPDAGDDDGETVECIAEATAPTPPSIKDACGNAITPTGPEIGGTYDGCEGTRTYTWTYMDCAGNTDKWTYTFLIEYEDFVIGMEDGSMTVECLAEATEPVPPSVNDNCGNPITPTGPIVTDSPDPLSCEGTRTYTWTYTDCEGNSHDWNYMYTIEYEDFVIGVQDGSKTVACLAEATEPVLPSVNDNCGNMITPTGPVVTDSPAPLSCEGTRTYTWTYTDCAGNSHDWSYVYTIEYEDFEINEDDGSITVACLAEATEPAPPSVNDNCGNIITPTGPVVTDSPAPLSCEGTRTYTWTYTDCAGNSHDWSYVYTIEYEDFVIGASDGKETVECIEDVYEPTPPLVTDNCGIPLSPSGPEVTDAGDNLECGGTRTYTWTYTDCEGNTHSWNYVFTINDTTAPDITREAEDKTVECDGNGNQAELQAWLGTYGGAMAEDNCGEVSWSMQISEKMDDCGNTGYMTFIFTARDECGNETPTTATFTIIDETVPEITTPAANAVVECDGAGNGDALQAWLDDHGGAEASDVCGGVSWTYEMSSEPGCGGTEVITAIFTATDDCGNPSQTSATFTIEDNTNPVIEAPATADIACSDPLPAIDDAVVYDVCSGVTVESSIDPYEVDVCNGYQVTYRWIATDECGNSSAATSTFNVLPDTDAPVIIPVHPAIADVPNGGTLPPVECNNADPDWNPFTMTENAVEATDDCSGVTVTFVDELVEDGCETKAGFVSKWICTWTATDECGNSSSYSVYMLIVDTAPPVFDQQPEDVTVGCGEMPEMPEVTAHDACSDVDISLAVSSSPGECAGERMVIRTWTAEDACGNKSYLYQRILQIDTEAPRIILRDDLNDYEDGDEIYVDCEDFNDYIFLESAARAMDNCDDDPEISYDFRLYSPESNCEAKGYNRKLEIEWTATDGCGNATTLGLTIYGIDETAPVFDEAPAVICATSDNIPAAEGVSATDACGTVDLSVSDADASDCGDGLVIERTWVAVDNCGNTSEFVQMIVLDDEAAPTITVNHPAFEGASSGDEVVVPADCASGNEYAVPDIASLIAVTDACTGDGEANITVALDEEGSCAVGFLYALTLTIEAADACGNMATATYLLKVQDMEGPDFAGTPASLTLDCGEAYPDPTVVDACGGVVALSVVDSGDPDVCNATGEPLIRTWTAEDACGNTSTFVQSIQIIDNTPPVFVGLPDDECIEDGNVPAAPEVTAVDDCGDEALDVVMVETVEDGDCGQLITRTWTTTDACGNEASAVQYLIETDTEAPSIEFIHPDLDDLSSGATLEMSCVNFQDDNVPDYDASAVSVSDNCAADIAVAFTYELVGLGDCLTDGYLERYKLTWTATDPCGNTSSVELYVNAIDNSPPVVFERPASVVNLYCDEPIPAPMELFVVDNCSGVTVDYVEETTYPSPGMTAIGRTWTATDGCGNTEIVTQWIKIQDYELECHFLNYENEVTCGSDDNTITVAVTGGTAPYTYQWDLVDCDGIMVEGMDGPTLTFIAGFTPLNFVVEVTDANGCSTTCTLTVPCSKDKGNRSSQGVGVGLGNGGGLGNGPGPVRPGGNLVVFPNPSTGQYYLQFEHSFDKPTRIIVQNLMGQHVQVTKFDYIAAEPIQLDITELPDGMYTIMVEVDGVINSAHKVIKEQ